LCVVVTLAPLLQPVYSGRRSTASVAGSCWVQSHSPFAIYNHHLVISPIMFLKFLWRWGLLFPSHRLPDVNCRWIGMLIGYWRWERFNHQIRRYEFLSMILTTIVPYCSGSRTPWECDEWKRYLSCFLLQTTVAWMASSCLSIVVMHSFK